MFNKIKDPVSCLTHMAWAILAIPVTIVLVVLASLYATPTHVVSFAIFGVSLIFLYSASTIYHMIKSPRLQQFLRKLDHSMIFVLIAGTYTPMALVILHGAWGISILSVIWGIAALGILLKIFWFNIPRWVSTMMYILMGWISVIAIVPLSRALPVGGIALLFAGGIVYTLGGVIYAIKKPHFNFKHFGFHEVFHIFVMAGSALHVIMMFAFVLPVI